MTHKELARVTSVVSGLEPDHRFHTFALQLDFGSSSQGFGHLVLSERLAQDFSQDVCTLFGVQYPQNIVNRQCLALRCFDSYNEAIEGIEVDGRRFTITRWRRKHEPDVPTVLQAREQKLQDTIDRHQRCIRDAFMELHQLRTHYTDWETT